MKRTFASSWLCLIVSLALLGCATTANYEKILDSWLGAPAERLVQSWGAPASAFRLPSGNEIYIYDRRSSSTYTTPTRVQQGPGMFIGNMYYPGQTTITGGQAIPISRACRTEFTVSSAGVITNWRYEGNACTARSPK